MRKTMNDLAEYLKVIILPEPDEAGIHAFWEFLNQLFDALIVNGEAYDKHTKVAHEYENRTTLSVYYPFLHHVKTLLMNVGLYGAWAENERCLFCDNNILNKKLAVAKTIEVLRFLTDCGMSFEGVDVNNKKQNFADIQSIKVSCPDNPTMLMGLKVMALAERELGTLGNQDIFLRCDYRVLRAEETDVTAIIKDTIRTLPADVQDFVLHLHQRSLDNGYKCVVEIKGFWIYIKYAYKRKDIWGINASLNNGFHINVKAQNMDKYTDTIETFEPVLQEVIAAGFGCGRKIATIGYCDGGCRGMIIPLDDSVLNLGDDIRAWFDHEMAAL